MTEPARPTDDQITRLTDAAALAFSYHYHKDCGNAVTHIAARRFSPLTFLLAETILAAGANETAALREVVGDKGKYPQDHGR